MSREAARQVARVVASRIAWHAPWARSGVIGWMASPMSATRPRLQVRGRPAVVDVVAYHSGRWGGIDDGGYRLVPAAEKLAQPRCGVTGIVCSCRRIPHRVPDDPVAAGGSQAEARPLAPGLD